MAIDPKQIQAAFLEAIAAKPEERAAVLDRLCAGDAELRRRVEMLIRAHDDSGELPAAGEVVDTISFEPKPVQPAALQAGCVFAGRYKLREKLGEGGMGIVWVADQTAPVQRRIALKVIKSTDDSRRLLARFEQERQALALMDHPHIAKVFDAGVSDDGRPYFAMELIKGVPLTKYCDEAKLTPKERLELFVPVCQAVQHAHQKGIIHRDLKPSNILVGLYDGRPVPKVIDFGVAKATGPQISEQSIYTEVGTMIGTVEYMSPEQAELNNLDIDTRSDIYALGVILYELLTGGVPFSRKEMKAAGFAEMLRIIKEVEPPKPSTRLSGSGTLPSVAACRHTEPNKLTRLVRGELDWIVMKCLEKDRSRRYETANGLSMEIQRYLANQPVEAGPPSATYRLRKFVRRNRPQVIAVSLVLLALLAGIAGTSLGLVEARTQRDRAEQARHAEADRAEGERVARVEAQAAERLAGERLVQVNSEKKRAEENLQVARAVQDFLQNKLLGQADVYAQADSLARAGGPVGETRENPTIRELLDRAAKELTPEKIEGNFPRQPLVQAEILHTVGLTYSGVGEFERAIDFLKRALVINRQHLGQDNLNTLLTMQDLAITYQGAWRLDLAVPLLDETLKLSKVKLGPDHPETLIVMMYLAVTYLDAGRLDLALPLLEETLKLSKVKPGPDHPETLKVMTNLAMAYKEAGKLDLAVPLLEESLKLSKALLGHDHPNTLSKMHNLACAYSEIGKPELALTLFDKTLKLEKAIMGHDHRVTLLTMRNFALTYQENGKLDLAFPLFEETLILRKKKLGPEHSDTVESMGDLALAYWRRNQLDKSIPLFEECLKNQEKRFGQDNAITLNTQACLGVNYKDAGRLKEALPLLEAAHQAATKYTHLVWVGGQLLDAYAKAGENAKLANLLPKVLSDARGFPKESPNRVGMLAQIGAVLLEQQKWAEAEPILRECLTLGEKKQPNNWRTFETKSMLGGALLGEKKYAGLEQLLLTGYEGMKKREKTIPPNRQSRIPEGINRLVQLYEATGKKDEAAKWRLERAKYQVAAPKQQGKK